MHLMPNGSSEPPPALPELAIQSALKFSHPSHVSLANSSASVKLK